MKNVHDFKITILLATFNSSNFLDEQITSIINQTHQRWKLIIRDDSVQLSESALKRIHKWCLLDKRISLLQDENSKINLGVSNNFFYLLQHAFNLNPKEENEYFSFCDQDDWWRSDKLELSLREMVELEKGSISKPILVYSDLKVVGSDRSLIHSSMFEYQGTGPKDSNLLQTLLFQNFVTGSTILINRAAAKIILESIKFTKDISIFDWWMAKVISLRGQLKFIKEPLVEYRQHQDNVIGAKGFSLFQKSGPFSLWKRGQKNLLNSFYDCNNLKIFFLNQLTTKQLDLLNNYLRLLSTPIYFPFIRIFYIFSFGFYCKSKRRFLIFILRLLFLRNNNFIKTIG